MIQAVKKNIIVQVVERENTTASGLILKGAEDPNPPARVVAVGPQIDCGVAVDDLVIVDWTRVGRFQHDSRTYYVTDQSNVMAVFDQ
jgi:co-chaperonin GroES (HSP10)